MKLIASFWQAQSAAFRGCRKTFHRFAFLVLMTLYGAGCTIDPEYNQRLATVRTDFMGNEIVGVWVAKYYTDRTTLLLRPDGTGHMTETPEGRSDRRWEYVIKWHYSGGGIWEGTKNNQGLTMHYNGNDLLVQFGWAAHVVFVNSDNETAVDEHLRKRR